jgi:hypothetical protein
MTLAWQYLLTLATNAKGLWHRQILHAPGISSVQFGMLRQSGELQQWKRSITYAEAEQRDDPAILFRLAIARRTLADV